MRGHFQSVSSAEWPAEGRRVRFHRQRIYMIRLKQIKNVTMNKNVNVHVCSCTMTSLNLPSFKKVNIQLTDRRKNWSVFGIYKPKINLLRKNQHLIPKQKDACVSESPLKKKKPSIPAAVHDDLYGGFCLRSIQQMNIHEAMPHP